MTADRRAKPLHITLAALLYALAAVFLFWPILQVARGGLVGAGGRLTS